MNLIKTLCAIGLVIITINISFSQIKWSPEYSTGKYEFLKGIIYADDNYFYVWTTDSKSKSEAEGWYNNYCPVFFKYDFKNPDLIKMAVLEPPAVNKGENKFIDMVNLKSSVIMISCVSKENKMNDVYINKINLDEVKTIKDPTIVMKNLNLKIQSTFYNTTKEFMYSVSADKEHIVFYYGYGEKNCDIYYCVINSNAEIEYEGKVNVAGHFVLDAYYFDNKIAFFVNTNPPSDYRKNSRRLYIYDLKNNIALFDDIFSTDEKMVYWSPYFWKDEKLILVNKDDLKMKFYMYDTLGKTEIKIIESNKDFVNYFTAKNIPEYYSEDIEIKNNILYMNGEHGLTYTVSHESNGATYYSEKSEFENITVGKYKFEDNEFRLFCIPKQQFSKNDRGRYSSYFHKIVDDKILVFYNENPKQLSIPEKATSQKFDPAKGIFVCYIVDENDKTSKTVICDNSQKGAITPAFCKIFNDKMILINDNSNKLSYGVINLQDFLK